MVVWQYPWILFGILPVIIVAGMALNKNGGRLHRLTVVLLSFAALLTLLAASRPQVTVTATAQRVNLVVDDSAASATAFFRDPQKLRRFAQHHLPHGTHIRVELLGRHLRFLPIDSTLTPGLFQQRHFPPDAAHHIHWHALSTAHIRGPVWLFTTAYHHWPQRAPKTPLALTLSHPHAADVGIRFLRVRRDAEGIVNVGIVLDATGPLDAELQVRRNATLITREALRFHRAGVRVINVIDHKASHGQILTYHVRLISSDPWPADNRATVVLPTRRPTRILWVTDGSAAGSDGKNMRIMSPSSLPAVLSKFSAYRCVVLDNVSSRELRFAQVSALQRWVRDDFGSLVILGASRAFGAGGYADAEPVSRCLNSLSPLSSHLPKRTPTHVIFLIDTSGSMGRHVSGTGGQTRFDLARAGIAGAMSILGLRTHITVLAFSGRTIQIAGHTPAAIMHHLAHIQPNGSTRPDSALPLLRRLMHHHDWLILITDGAVPKLSPQPWKRLIRSTYSHMIIIAARQSRAIRRFIRSSRVRLVQTADEQQWRILLRRAARHAMLESMDTTPLHWTTFHAAGNPLSGTTRQWIRTYLRHRAIALAGNRHRNISLAAYWHVGLGKVAAMACNPQSPADGKLLRRMLHLAAAGAGSRHWQIDLRGIHNPDRPMSDYLQNPSWQANWRLRVSADRRRDFSLKLNAIRFAHGHEVSIPMPTVGPGVFQIYFHARHDAFTITVTGSRKSKTKPGRVHLIGRVWPRILPGPWFPATGYPSSPAWKNCQLINRASSQSTLWRPTVQRHLSLGNWLEILAAACVLGAMLCEIGRRRNPLPT